MSDARKLFRISSAADVTVRAACSCFWSVRRADTALEAPATTTALTIRATSISSRAISMDTPRWSCNFRRSASMRCHLPFISYGAGFAPQG